MDNQIKIELKEEFKQKLGNKLAYIGDRGQEHLDKIADFWVSKIDTLLKSQRDSRDKELREKIEQELEIQKQVQEKSKKIVAIGRARVAGMVAEKYTRIGKIEALQNILSLLKEDIKN